MFYILSKCNRTQSFKDSNHTNEMKPQKLWNCCLIIRKRTSPFYFVRTIHQNVSIRKTHGFCTSPFFAQTWRFLFRLPTMTKFTFMSFSDCVHVKHYGGHALRSPLLKYYFEKQYFRRTWFLFRQNTCLIDHFVQKLSYTASLDTFVRVLFVVTTAYMYNYIYISYHDDDRTYYNSISKKQTEGIGTYMPQQGDIYGCAPRMSRIFIFFFDTLINYLNIRGLWSGDRIAAIIADGLRVDKMSCRRADGRLDMSWSSLITATVNGVFVPDPDEGCTDNCCVVRGPSES